MKKPSLAIDRLQQFLQTRTATFRLATCTCQNIRKGLLRSLITLQHRRLTIPMITVCNKDTLCTESLPAQLRKRLSPLLSIRLTNKTALRKAGVYVHVPEESSMIRKSEAVPSTVNLYITHQVSTRRCGAPKQDLIEAHPAPLLLPVRMEL